MTCLANTRRQHFLGSKCLNNRLSHLKGTTKTLSIWHSCFHPGGDKGKRVLPSGRVNLAPVSTMWGETCSPPALLTEPAWRWFLQWEYNSSSLHTDRLSTERTAGHKTRNAYTQMLTVGRGHCPLKARACFEYRQRTRKHYRMWRPENPTMSFVTHAVTPVSHQVREKRKWYLLSSIFPFAGEAVNRRNW